MRMPENFDAEVYAVVAEIPAGKVVSYKQIARLITGCHEGCSRSNQSSL